jgi:hypothetical protein
MQHYKIASDFYASDSEPVTMTEFEEMLTECGWEIPKLRETQRNGHDVWVNDNNEIILEATKPACEVFGLRTTLVNCGGDRSLVTNGDSKFWVDSMDLSKELLPLIKNSREEEEAYSEWCRNANASEEM